MNLKIIHKITFFFSFYIIALLFYKNFVKPLIISEYFKVMLQQFKITYFELNHVFFGILHYIALAFRAETRITRTTESKT